MSLQPVELAQFAWGPALAVLLYSLHVRGSKSSALLVRWQLPFPRGRVAVLVLAAWSAAALSLTRLAYSWWKSQSIRVDGDLMSAKYEQALRAVCVGVDA